MIARNASAASCVFVAVAAIMFASARTAFTAEPVTPAVLYLTNGGRLSGELGWYGVNRRVIDNRKHAAFSSGGALKRA